MRHNRCGQPPTTPAPNPLRPASHYSRPQPAAASLRLLPPPTRCGQPPATPAPNPLRPASGYLAAPNPLRPASGTPAPNPLRPGYSRPQPAAASLPATPAAASLPLLPPPTRHSSERGNLVPRSPLRCGTLPVRAGPSSPVRGQPPATPAPNPSFQRTRESRPPVAPTLWDPPRSGKPLPVRGRPFLFRWWQAFPLPLVASLSSPVRGKPFLSRSW